MSLQNKSAAMDKMFAPSRFNRRIGTDEWHLSPTCTLDERGFIQECNKAAETLFGYCRHELVWQHISCLLPRLSEFALMERNRLNPLPNHIRHGRNEYEAINKQGSIMRCRLSFTLVKHEGTLTIRLIVRSVAESNT